MLFHHYCTWWTIVKPWLTLCFCPWHPPASLQSPASTRRGRLRISALRCRARRASGQSGWYYTYPSQTYCIRSYQSGGICWDYHSQKYERHDPSHQPAIIMKSSSGGLWWLKVEMVLCEMMCVLLDDWGGFFLDGFRTQQVSLTNSGSSQFTVCGRWFTWFDVSEDCWCMLMWCCHCHCTLHCKPKFQPLTIECWWKFPRFFQFCFACIYKIKIIWSTVTVPNQICKITVHYDTDTHIKLHMMHYYAILQLITFNMFVSFLPCPLFPILGFPGIFAVTCGGWHKHPLPRCWYCRQRDDLSMYIMNDAPGRSFLSFLSRNLVYKFIMISHHQTILK